MKRLFVGLLVCAFLVFFFSVENVGAAVISCDDVNQKMFAISSATNAHGEEWNQTNYEYEVCFNDYFRGIHTPENGIEHECTAGNNIILRLSNYTNAHAEVKGQGSPDYQDVCYGDLACFNTTGECNDTSVGGGTDYATIVSLDDLTDAHISFTDVYSQKICCKAEYLPRCDYDGVCEPNSPQEESVQNCPDCQAVCGNNVVEGIEQCDGTNLEGYDCTNYSQESGYVGGTLACYPNSNLQFACTFDVTGCSVAQCSDGIDNDGDGGCDFGGCSGLPPDFACANAQDNNEADVDSACQNGEDDDGDGAVDLADDGCENSQDNSETICGDGVVDTETGEECDCGGDSCTLAELNDQTCQDVNSAYRGGSLNCTSTCTFEVSNCEGNPGFCQENEPFLISDNSGALLSPSSCQDYNQVYPGNSAQNISDRKELCLNDCVPGASDPVNNGYAGVPLTDWGCGWDESKDECYFYFSNTDGSGEQCRLDYQLLKQCGPNDPFRLVSVTATPVTCDAGCGVGQSCETQIMCPRVIQLPFIGVFGIILSVIVISLAYVYLRRRK